METHAVPLKNAEGKITSLLGITRDVTEKRKNFQELQKSRNFQESILSALSSAICVINSSGVIISTNETWKQFAIENGAVLSAIGAEVNYLLTCKNSVDSGDEYAAKALKGITQVLKREKEFFAMEYPCHSPAEKRWFQMRVTVFKGDLGGAVISHLDITERKIAEEAVKQSEEKYRTIIEQAPDGIFISDRDTFFVDVNKSGCSMLGYTKEELLKMKFTEVISPENLKNNPIRIDELNSGRIVLSERKVVRKDGSEILVEINAKLRPDGKYQSFIRDITDRKKAEQAVKESEEKYRTLVEQAEDAIALYDASGKILDVNTGSVKLLG